MNQLMRQALPSDFARIIELNTGAVQHTSAMNVSRIVELDALSIYHQVFCVDGKVAAFILAMRDDANYSNDNFAFFKSHTKHFLYVDRIVVDASFSGLNIGSQLYQNLFQFAANNKIPHIVCEYNIEPPNEPSRRFHDKFGFTEIGTQWLDGCKKRVSLQVADIRL